MRPGKVGNGTREIVLLLFGVVLITSASCDNKNQPETMSERYQHQIDSSADGTTTAPPTLASETNNSTPVTASNKPAAEFIDGGTVKRSKSSTTINRNSNVVESTSESPNRHQSQTALGDRNLASTKSVVNEVHSAIEDFTASGVSNVSGVVSTSTFVPAGRSLVRRDSLIIDDGDPCRAFTEGDPDAKVLYSPGYPGNYPKKANCVVILEAPPGHLLRLDFRDHFDVEPSENCKFDFLEIRDGMYGFSTQIGQYCGQEFPPMVTSRERHLWLHFESDENIEYSGFKMVYEYIQRPNTSMQPELDTCVQHRSGEEGYLNRSDIPQERVLISTKHNMPLECMWIIEVPENWKIQLQFLKFELVRPNDCDINFVDIYPERTDIPHQIAKYCGSRADSVTSEKNILNVRFVAEAAAAKSNFLALYTAFRDKPAQASCEPDEYDCEDATCISGALRCNGKVNCRFRWDEDECPKEEDAGMGSKHIIIIMVIFSLILCGMCGVFMFKCIRKLIEDHRTIRENIRESREFRLDELGRKSTKTSQDISRKHSKKRSPTPDPHVGPMDHTMLADNISCCMQAETLIPIPIRASEPMTVVRSNGDTFPRGVYPSSVVGGRHGYGHHGCGGDAAPGGAGEGEEADAEPPDTCDIACQTRESLFRPPTLQQSSSSGEEQPARFSTFGYEGSRRTPRYTAEAVIEMEQVAAASGQSAGGGGGGHQRAETRSAPDVIIMASSNANAAGSMSH